jgi:hypothetical protein
VAGEFGQETFLGVQFSHEMADSARKASLFMNMYFTPFLRNLFFCKQRPFAAQNYV